MTEKRRVGIAFQGGGFPAGALGAGVVKYLVEKGAFDEYDIDVFSGTSAGALVASVCWGQKLKGAMQEAPEILEKQWMHFAWGLGTQCESRANVPTRWGYCADESHASVSFRKHDCSVIEKSNERLDSHLHFSR